MKLLLNTFLLLFTSTNAALAFAGGTVGQPANPEIPAMAPPVVAPLPQAPLGVPVSPIEHGYYSGVSAGRSEIKPDTINQSIVASSLASQSFTNISTSENDKKTGWKIYGGYQFNRNLAIEGGYIDLGKFSASGTGSNVSNSQAATATASERVTGVFLDGIGIIPVGNVASLFGKVGAFRSNADLDVSVTNLNTGARIAGSANDSKTDLTYGLGGSVRLTPNLNLRIEWERFKNIGKDFQGLGNSGADVDFVSLGLVYKPAFQTTWW